MSFQYLNPTSKRGAVFVAAKSGPKKDGGILLMNWKAEDDTYGGEEPLLPSAKRVKPTPDFEAGQSPEKSAKTDIFGAKTTDLAGAELSVFTKPFATLNKRDFRILREHNGIRISYPFQNSLEFRVIRDWEESGLIQPVKANISKNLPHLRHPTAVQMQVIPAALKFKDIICTAPTGSGKTLAFLLPILNFLYFMPRIKSNKAHLGPYAIVISPTRELVLQLADVFDKAAAGLKLKSKVILGGHNKLETMFEPAEIVFATVGRYADLLSAKEASLEQCYYVVIDEADFMISNNLAEPLDFILESIANLNNKPADPTEAVQEEDKMEKFEGLVRVTQLFSATMPERLKKLTEKYLRNPVNVVVEADQTQLEKKKHYFEYLGDDGEGLFGQKVRLLRVWLRKMDFKIIVFFNSKHEIDSCSGMLRDGRIRVGCYHSGLDQSEREQVIAKFRDGDFDVLLSTDLGGRGLDIEDVRSVINFDGPKDFEQYIHRTGRTARAGKSGACLSFFTKRDAHLFSDLAVVLEAGKQAIPDFLRPFAQKKQAKNLNMVLVD